MSRTIADLRDSVSGQLQGLNLNNVKNINVVFERTARQLSQLIYIPEVVGRQQVTLYDGVTDYASFTDIFGNQIVDFRPQGVSRGTTEFAYHYPNQQFDRNKDALSTGSAITFEFNKGTGIMRVVSSRPQPRIELDPMTATTGWTAAGTASGLALDQTVFWQEPGSLRFNVSTGTGTFTKTISTVDLTNYTGVGVVFLAMRIPTAANLTSMSIRIGSDSSNYYEVTGVTSGFLGSWTSNDWLLTKFDLANATTTGTPTITSIKYVQISIVASGTLTNFYVGDLWIALPSPFTLIYPSSSFFLASGATTPSQTITNNADTILLGDSAYAIYEIMSAMNVAEQQGGSIAGGLLAGMSAKVNGIRGYRGVLIQPGLLDLYRSDNPTETVKTVGNYYND